MQHTKAVYREISVSRYSKIWLFRLHVRSFDIISKGGSYMKKFWKIPVITCLLTALLLTGCSSESSSSESQSSSSSQSSSMTAAEANERIDEDSISLIQFEEPKIGDKIATIQTSEGDITVRFFPEQAPKAVENFLTHAENGYYNGLTFHRVICDFIIQGGDPNGDGTGGESIWGEPFEDEYSTDLWHFRGALAMANAGPDTNGSQFYIVQASKVADETIAEMEEGNVPQVVIDKYKEVGGHPNLDGRYTVFGQVIDGMDVVDIIANVSVNAQYKPAEDVIIEMITVSEYTGEDSDADASSSESSSSESSSSESTGA